MLGAAERLSSHAEHSLQAVPNVRHFSQVLSKWAYGLGMLSIVVALVASGALAVQHLTGVSLPGCGGVSRPSSGMSITGEEAPKPACASLEAHPLGSLGGMVYGIKAIAARESVGKVPAERAWWPVSFVGAAYFAGALAGWLVVGIQGRRVAAVIRWVVVGGGMASVAYLIVIVLEKKYCQYCITSHIANLALVGSVMLGFRRS